ncbi:MAG TPA: hypothetical protein VNO32_13155 [Candidatus Acidoferrum sp.]|nr:hypothetical protein [Candidatus Acidoferrum sp.]
MKIKVAITALALAVVLSPAARGQNCNRELLANRGGCPPILRPYPVIGAIADKYNQIGGSNGILGPATTNEQPAPFGGRFQEFAHGVIYFHGSTGAYEVHGAILDLWTQLGRTAFGYPTTDETSVPEDGRGRFNHFRLVQLLPAIEERSIYWTSSTQAHSVIGAIRKKWGEWEWQRGKLGYPTGEEFQDGDGRKSFFEYGYIRWTNDQAGAQVTTYDNSPESLTDRCSGEVSFPTSYGAQATDLGAVIMKRGTNGYSDWTPIFTVGLDDSSHVRWYCHSTTGNFIDPGTWVLRSTGAACTFSGNGGILKPSSDAGGSSGGGGSGGGGSGVACTTTVNLVSTDSAGWTAEQSRCNGHTNRFRARLGPDRLLESLCVAGTNP